MKKTASFFLITCLLFFSCKKREGCNGCPEVISLTPALGFQGDTVIVVGRNFSTILTGNVVRFNETVVPAADMIFGNVNQIKVRVPANCGTGPVSVSINNELFSEPGPVFTYEYAHIQSIIPAEGKKGDTISIRGERFSTGINTVKFNGSKALVLSQSDSLIRAVVPVNCESGVVTITLPNGLTVNNNIRFKYIYTYTVSTFAGIPQTEGNVNGPLLSATFKDLHGTVVDSRSRIIYVADGSCIRKIFNGEVTNFAGLQTTKGYKDGFGKDALFDTPGDMAVNREGEIFIPDVNNNCIRKITATTFVSTYCGKGLQPGDQDGRATAALLGLPYSIDLYKDSLFFIGDVSNKKIKQCDTKANVLTLPLKSISECTQLAIKDKYTLFGTDALKNKIMKIDLLTGEVLVFAGTGSGGTLDGDASIATFSAPGGIAIRTAQGKPEIYIADAGSHLIRKIDPDNKVTTIMGAGSGYADGENKNALFNTPNHIAFDASNTSIMYITDSGNKIIRKVMID